MRRVAERLGNTPAVCRASYIHPLVIARYHEGITLDQYRPRALRRLRHQQPEYELEELALLCLLATDRAGRVEDRALPPPVREALRAAS